jgi:predicted DNA-binding antitoxin AbrB/MazE fold protein
MTFYTDAIYEGGVLRPLVPLDLKENEIVSLSISPAVDASIKDAEGSRQRSVVMRHVAKVESRPNDTPRDGLSNRDHDRIIYGK